MGQPTAPSTESLSVTDNRTGKQYTIPITNNSIPATAFKDIKAKARPGEREENETERGLRVSDKVWVFQGRGSNTVLKSVSFQGIP